MAGTPKCTPGFKQQAVELYRKSYTAYAEAARGPGAYPGSLSGWVRQAGQGGRGRSRIAEPAPDGRGPAQAAKGERAAEARERDPFKSRRLLRGQGSVKRAKFELVAVLGCRHPASGPRSVAQGRGPAHGPRDGRGAGRRRAQDGDSAQGPREGPPPSFGPREPVRVAAHRQDRGRERHRAVHGVGFEPAGQRRGGVPDGGRQSGTRPCAHLLWQGRGRARDIRAHRVLLQQGQDSLHAWPAQPRGVRKKQMEESRPKAA